MSSVQLSPKLSLADFVALPETKPASEYFEWQRIVLDAEGEVENTFESRRTG